MQCQMSSSSEIKNSKTVHMKAYRTHRGSIVGYIPLTNGSESGSRRPKNTWIRWIRIRNTDTKVRKTFQM
jgi:hypothetical protein